MKNLTLIAFFCLLGGVINAQDSLKTVQPTQDTTIQKVMHLIVTDTRKEYIGEILSDDGRELLLETIKLGKIYLLKSEITEIKKLDSYKDAKDIENGTYTGNHLSGTRYFLGTSAFKIEEEESYMAFHAWGYEFQKNLENSWTFGFMTSWVGAPVVLTAKTSIKLEDNLHMSVGALAGTSSWLARGRYTGQLAFTNFTFGNVNNNLTLSFGGLFIQDLQPETRQIEIWNPATVTSSWIEETTDNSSQSFLGSMGMNFKIGEKTSFCMEIIYSTNPNTNVLIATPGFKMENPNKDVFQFGISTVSINRTDGTSNLFPLPTLTLFRKIK